jgi:poly(3-hydroxybutyrate) depolymerase
MNRFITRILMLAALCGLAHAAPNLAPGVGRFEFQRAGKTVPVWYFIPADAEPETPVLFVMHGVNRNADKYRDDWQVHAKKHRFILIVPEFSEKEFPGDVGYNLGGTVDANKRPQPPERWAFTFIESIFDEVRTRVGNRSEKYHLYGHSAGAQFVHRFLYYLPDARVANVVAANSGWYTLPDPKTDFPYGLRGSRVTNQALRTMLQRPVVILLGTEDNDPNHKHLRRASDAMKQGPHRFARGNFFFNAAKRKAEELKVPFGWRLATAPGIGHSDPGMGAFAVEWLFGSD